MRYPNAQQLDAPEQLRKKIDELHKMEDDEAIKNDFIRRVKVEKPGKRVRYTYTKLTERDENQFRLLATAGCTVEEIGAIMEVAPNTIERNPKISQIIIQGKQNLKMNIRKKQIEVGLAGNPQMLIWLGKNLLGQTERIQVDENENKLIEVKIVDLTSNKLSSDALPALSSSANDSNDTNNENNANDLPVLEHQP